MRTQGTYYIRGTEGRKDGRTEGRNAENYVPPLFFEKAGDKKKKKVVTPWNWGPVQQTAFDCIIEKLTSPPVLAYSDYTKPFVHTIDTSGDGLGAVLHQEQDGKKCVIAYASRSLRASECKYFWP